MTMGNPIHVSTAMNLIAKPVHKRDSALFIHCLLDREFVYSVPVFFLYFFADVVPKGPVQKLERM